ncbi:creatinine amidohydrolase [Prauserella isguenensis]|uniref:Creatinine amidohydrolase n=1 Tax=Prauserella isguenensis TaxID=1470180 RepID=A0A839S2P7_9PSEU|nr:creatininase family protein [Prauserella isguenensis]MBB3051662.1 creatinine amidohydrolase [Prauserella isguenensis]
MNTLRLAELTTEDAERAVTASPLVLLPAGAFEQHGPGLPLSTDLVRADRIAELVAAELDGRALLGPSLPVGVSPHHLAFAGTVSLTTTTFAAVVREYVESLHRHGWRKILVVNGHGGNNASLSTVAQDLLVTHPDLGFAWTPLTPLASDVVADMDVSEVHGHSGEAETAQLRRLAPELVHEKRLVPGTTRRAELDSLGTLSRQAAITFPVTYDRLSRNGVLGDPRRAAAGHGKSLVDAIVARIAGFAEEWLAS